jgi:hypothetical protein
MAEMHSGDLFNLQMLKDAIETPFLGSLWVEGDSGMMTPHVCEAVLGDGLQLLTVSTINQRPNYWVMRVDSRWEQSNFYTGGEDTIGEHIDEVLDAIENECGRVGVGLDHPCDNCGDDWCACNADSGEQFPALDDENGCSWGRIRWSWLMNAIGYPPIIKQGQPRLAA